MKKLIILLCSILFVIVSYAQENSAVTQKLEARYTRVYYMYNKDVPSASYYEVGIGDKAGICDANGKEVIAPKRYTYVSYYYNKDVPSASYYDVKIGDKMGICDANGKEVIAPKRYRYVSYYYNKDVPSASYYHVGIGDKAGICDANGKEVIAPERYTRINYWYNKDVPSASYYDVEIGDKMGICDANGKEVIAPERYTWAVYLYNKDVPSASCYHVEIGDKKGICNAKGKEIFISESDKYKSVSEGLLPCSRDGLWGYLDMETGETIIPFQYTSAESFKDGIAKVSNGTISFLISHPKKGDGKQLAQLSITEGGKSDVDMNIHETDKKADNTFAVIIANQNYTDFVVSYAINDGRVFKEYCLKTLGIPLSNIFYFEDATLNNIHGAITRLKDIADVYEGEAKLIFYYVGQGLTDDADRMAYLLPTDGALTTVKESGYSVEKLYAELGGLNVVSSTLLLDAGYNGASREDRMLQSARGVAVRHRPSRPIGNMICMNAASPGETALAYQKKSHGLFTYFLLKKLQESKGVCSLKELSDYIVMQVKRQSLAEQGKLQTPALVYPESIDLSQINF